MNEREWLYERENIRILSITLVGCFKCHLLYFFCEANASSRRRQAKRGALKASSTHGETALESTFAPSFK